MTRRDYILLATTMRAQLPSRQFHTYGALATATTQWQDDCIAIAWALSGDNPRFDKARFLTDCGLDEDAISTAEIG